MLPDFINDIQRLRKEQAIVSLLEENTELEVIVNDEYVYSRIEGSIRALRSSGYENLDIQAIRESYLSSFHSMARKGFFSYDRALDDSSN